MKKAIAVVLLGGLCAVEAGAATITWTGAAGEWDYGAAGNWSPALPKNNDYQDIVRFGGTATPGTISVITPYGTSSSRQHEGVEFTSAGWTLDVDYSSLGKVNSAGVGTNTINYGFEVQQAGTWTIGEGNTLSIAKVLYLKNFNVTLAGGGTLLTNGGLGGYGSGTFGMHLTGGTTLRIDAAQVHDGGTTAKVYISDSLSKLELKTTPANATALFGTRIVNETAESLQVRDIGGGYVQVYVPEPGTAALIGATGMAMLARRSRRQA